MVTRIYIFTWLILAGSTVGLYLGGQLIPEVQSLIGFFAATLVFIGMALMLPTAASNKYASR
jgi:hypothetical protein